MALRILDWDLCMMTMLDLLAQPYSRITLLVETFFPPWRYNPIVGVYLQPSIGL